MRTEHISKPLPKLTPNSQTLSSKKKKKTTTLSSKKETPNHSYFSVKIRKRKKMGSVYYILQVANIWK